MRRLGLLGLILFLTGCAVSLPSGTSRRDLQVTVIYADRDAINAEARARGLAGQANGFYDPLRNELWCPDENSASAFRTCGHELRHAVKGAFHP